jgi:hypothetical protein
LPGGTNELAGLQFARICHVGLARRSIVKRFTTMTITVVALLVGVASAVAADGGATVATVPVSFVLSSQSCSTLSTGTTISGSGTETSITTSRTDREGVTTIVNSTHAHGTATDQGGNVYVFNYSNSFRASNTPAEPGVFSGSMLDQFSLAGNGPANVHASFAAGIRTDFTIFSWDVLNSRGDPIDFAPGPVIHHCDPL